MILDLAILGNRRDVIAEASEKYQVLCPYTSLVGVLKQSNKPTEEMQ